MNKTVSKCLRIFGGVLVALLLILAGYLYWKWPIYPSSEKKLESISELREALVECEATKDCIVLDPAEYGTNSESFTLKLSNKFRNADPCGYYIFGTYPESDRKKSLSITSLPLDDFLRLEVAESVYRDAQTKLTKGSYPSQERYVNLELLCGEYYYLVSASFKTTGLPEQELSEREADLQALVYSVADRIIDAAEAP